jgi:hypothetical protein
VEHLNSLPFNIRHGGQGIQKFKLRSSGGSNNSRATFLADGIADVPRSLFSGSTRKRTFVLEDFDDHCEIPKSR